MKHIQPKPLRCLLFVFPLLLLISILFLCTDRHPSTLPDHIRQAKKLSQWLIKKNTRHNPAAYTTGHFTWDTEKSLRSWTYYNGLMMDAFARLGESDFVNAFYSANILPNGQINNTTNPNNVFTGTDIDSVAPARAIFLLDTSTYKNTLLLIYNYLSHYPTLTNLGNNFLHKFYIPWGESYPFSLDGLYMTLPFLALLANLASSDNAFQQINPPKIYDTIFDRMDWVTAHLKNEQTGLYYHGADSHGRPNGVVWLRGVGYYAMTQIDLIELLPDGNRKEKLKQDLLLFLDAMLQKQDVQTGLWRNVVNAPDNLSNNRFETSGSAMLAYTLLKTYNDGVTTDTKYLESGLKAFQGIMSNKVHQGIWGYKVQDIYRNSSVFSDPARYCVKAKYVQNEAKGLAPLLFATVEAEKWLKKTQKTDSRVVK